MGAKIRCKFHVKTVTLAEGQESLVACPVYSGSEENEAFYAATPCGSLKLDCARGGAFEFFKPGQEFFLDLVPCA